MNPMRFLDWVSYMLLFAGALNLGIWGIFEVDVIARVFGGSTALPSKILYVLIGLSALYEIGAWKAIRHRFCEMAA
ncbi:MAG: DUF378 domain-containing protein [Thermodesulfobacteriota bacterium]